jgi:hypothetical protein
MDNIKYFGKVKNVGFVSTRLAGTDGVSLETTKWERIFEQEGFDCFYFAGELDRPPERSYFSAEAHFTHPEINEIHHKVFDVSIRNRSTTEKIHQCDLVTYPSTFEGFGNAFLEAVYFHKPIVVNKYSIYTKDIKPKGFRAIELDGYVTSTAVKETKEILEDTNLCEEIVDHNYEIGKRFFSYSVLRRLLKGYIAEHMAIKN